MTNRKRETLSAREGRARHASPVTRHGRPKIAVHWTGSCGGCDVSFLELKEAFVEFLSQVEIVFWPALADAKRSDLEAMPRGAIDAALRTRENLEVAEVLRDRAKAVVAYGTCAHLGGIPALASVVRGWGEGASSSAFFPSLQGRGSKKGGAR